MSRDQLDELMQPLPKIEGEDMGALSTRQGAKFDQMIEYVEQSGIPPEDAGGHIWESQVDYWKTIAREIAKTFCPGMRVHSQGRADNWVRIEVKNKAMLAMLAMLVHDGEVSSATSGWDRVEGLKEKNFKVLTGTKSKYRAEWERMQQDRSVCELWLHIGRRFADYYGD